MPGGRRRVDVVLDPSFVTGLGELSLPALRARRREAEQEEADLSYLRRMLHGRMDIVRAEMARRRPDAGEESLVASLTEILTDPQRSTHGLGRHITVEPTRVEERQRAVEKVVADADISDVEELDDAGLEQALATLATHEAEVSETRRSVQDVMDVLSAELTARYRDGSASVDALLADPGA
jgi:hypothetical protein